MNSEVIGLQDRLARLEQDNTDLRMQFRNERRRFRVLGGLALAAVVGAILVSPANRAALAQGYGSTLRQLLNRVQALEAKTQPISLSGTEMTMTGVNLHLVDGSGSTNSTSGLGNLIIGYNALRNDGTDNRSGSHNLILGDSNNYSSYGGLVVGTFNSISGPYASVSGGAANEASGDSSFVSGGTSNTASGDGSSVSGGFLNTASAPDSSVSGGESNTASGLLSSISGGIGITQNNFAGWSGGNFHSP